MFLLSMFFFFIVYCFRLTNLCVGIHLGGSSILLLASMFEFLTDCRIVCAVLIRE